MKTNEEKTICMGEDCPYKKCKTCPAEDKRNMEKSASTERGFHSTEFVEITTPNGKKKYVSKPAE